MFPPGCARDFDFLIEERRQVLTSHECRVNPANGIAVLFVEKAGNQLRWQVEIAFSQLSAKCFSPFLPGDSRQDMGLQRRSDCSQYRVATALLILG